MHPNSFIFVIVVSISSTQGSCSENETVLPQHRMSKETGFAVCPKSCFESTVPGFVSIASSRRSIRDKYVLYEQQECLEYLDDSTTSKPEQICKKQPREIFNILRAMRMRTCCERSVVSALHNDVILSVVNGGNECVKILKQLIDTDGIASRITCALNEILFRYDCRQIYSIKHGCSDCKVRR